MLCLVVGGVKTDNHSFSVKLEIWIISKNMTTFMNSEKMTSCGKINIFTLVK